MENFKIFLLKELSMKNKLWLIALVAVIGFSFAACSDGGGGGGGDNPFIGTWVGGGLTVTFTDSTWNIVPGQGEALSGTYTRNGNTATHAETSGDAFTAVVSGNTMTLTVTVDGNKLPSFTLTKAAPSIAEFITWLAAQPANTAYTAYTYKLNVSDLGGDSDTSGSVGNVLSANNTKYVSLDLSDSTFTSIEDDAFSSCSNLTGVTIPDNVTSIGENAFSYCTNLTSVTIPNNVTSIGNWAFLGCSYLPAINVDTANTAYSSQDGVLYNKAKTTLIQYPAGKPDSTFTILDSVTAIEWQAFDNCISLTAINVDAGNTEYSSQDGVLYNKDKTSLIQYPAGKTDTTFTIPDSVTSIGNAFYYCTKLTSIIIPNSVTSIGWAAFGRCYSLTAINVDAGNTAYSSDNGVLYNKTKTTLIQYPVKKTDSTFTIPDSVTSIEGSAFQNCTSLTSVTIPGSVTTIGWNAFLNCTSLTSVTFATGSSIPDADFGGNAFPGGFGDTLKTAYSTGKAGTYTRAANGDTWTKQ
jgi:hypothetical protein